MRAKVIRPFRDKETLRSHRKGDVITVSESRFQDLGYFLEEASATEKLTPKRDSEGNCIPCKKLKDGKRANN